MPICNPIPSNPAIGVDITTHADTVQHLTENALTVTTLVTSPLYVESPVVPETQQQLHLDAENQEGDPQGYPQGQEEGHLADH